MCTKPASRLSRSSAEPGTAAAWPANSGTSCDASAISSTETKASTRIVPWMNSVGRSTATAPIAATCPALPLAKIVEDPAITQVQMKAASSAPNVTTRCALRRSGLGTNASTSTPMIAPANTTSIGASWPYSMLGAGIAPGTVAAAAASGVTAGFPSGQPRRLRPGLARDGLAPGRSNGPG